MTSYRRIAALDKGLEILDYLAGQREPVTATDVAHAVDAPHGTVMCHLATLEDRRYVRRLGDRYELGMALATAWARKKSLLEGARDRINRDIESITIPGGA